MSVRKMTAISIVAAVVIGASVLYGASSVPVPQLPNKISVDIVNNNDSSTVEKLSKLTLSMVDSNTKLYKNKKLGISLSAINVTEVKLQSDSTVELIQDGNFLYAKFSQSGTHTITASGIDTNGDNINTTLDFSVLNRTPEVYEPEVMFDISGDEILKFDGYKYFLDKDNENLTFEVSQKTINGVISNSANAITYYPSANSTYEDSFKITATDLDGASVSKTFLLKVSAKSETINVVDGWNLLGNSAKEGMDTSTIKATGDALWTYVNSVWNDSDTVVKPEQGFWLNSNEARDITVVPNGDTELFTQADARWTLRASPETTTLRSLRFGIDGVWTYKDNIWFDAINYPTFEVERFKGFWTLNSSIEEAVVQEANTTTDTNATVGTSILRHKYHKQNMDQETTVTDITGWAQDSNLLPGTLNEGQAIVTKNRVYLFDGAKKTSYTAQINDGTIGTWTIGSSLPGVISHTQAIVTKNRVYLLGGSGVKTVYTAPINDDGTITKWTTGTDLPEAVAYSQSVVTKNKVYLLGGLYGGYRKTVYVAPINDDGILGEWSTEADLPGVLGHSQAVVTKSRVYLLGGYNGSYTDIVYSAPIEGGTIGKWSTDASLPGAFGYSQAIATKNRVYLMGGAGGAFVNAVYTAHIDDNGVIGPWSTGTSLPANILQSHAVVTKNRVYLLGGRISSPTNKIYSAPFADGWEVTNINSNTTARTLALINKCYRHNIEKETTVDDITGWTEDSNSLPEEFAFSQLIVTKNRVYLFGGLTLNDGYTSKVYTAALNADGTVGTWRLGTSLPGVLAHSQAIILNNRVYLLGGLDNVGRNTVYTALINSDGFIGEWSTDTKLLSKFAYSQAFVTNSRVYQFSEDGFMYNASILENGTIGGWSKDVKTPRSFRDSQAVVTNSRVYVLGLDTEYVAIINEDGTIGEWKKGNVMPSGLLASQSIVTKNRVYMLGGYGATDNKAVYTAPINNDGIIGTWTMGTSLPGALSYSQAAVTKNRIYLFGGRDKNSNPSYRSVVYTAQFADGWEIDKLCTTYDINSTKETNTTVTFSSLNKYHKQNINQVTTVDDITGWTLDSNRLPSELGSAQAVVTKNRVYLFGGSTLKALYTAQINDGIIGAWTVPNSLPTVYFPQVVVTKSRVYILGGTNSSTVYTNTINDNGSIHDYNWTAVNSLPGPLGYSQAVVTKNRVYLLGGKDNSGNVQKTVYTAPINEDGIIGEWTIGTSLPGILSGSQAVITKNRVYLLGGNSGPIVDTVYTASINEDGIIGEWTIGTSLPEPMSGSQAVVTKNRVYLWGSNASYTAFIDNNGIIGEWTAATKIPEAFPYSQVVVTKSNVYMLGGSSTNKIYMAPFADGWEITENSY